MKKIKIAPVLFLAFLALTINANAQTKNNPVSENNTVRKFTAPVPYSAEAVSERLQTLNDGNKIKTTTKELIYADSKGRIRRETESLFNNKTQKSINIRDIPAGVDYYLNPITKIAYRIPIKTFSPGSQRISPPTGYSTTSESLGKKMIEGFETTGTLSITTIAPGTIGNEKPLETTSENWFSPELRVLVLSKRKDPQNGDYTYEMKNIKREEPDAALFSIPSDYKIVDSASVSDRFFIVEAPQ